MKKQVLEQILTIYAETNSLENFNFELIVQFTKHPNFINLAADAEITFEFFANTIKLFENNSYLFSDVLDIWQILNNDLLQQNYQLDKQQIPAEILKKIYELLTSILKKDLSKVHKMELFKGFKDSLNPTTLDLLVNYPIYIKHVIYGYQIKYLRELLPLYTVNFELIQIFLWQVIADHIPPVLPNGIIVLAVENQYWFNIAGKSLPSTEVAKAFLKTGLKMKKDPFFGGSAARNKFSQAITFDPNLKDAYIQRYLINKEKFSYELAIEDLMVLKNLEPNNDELYMQLGQLYKKLNKFELAIENFNAAIKLNPINANGYYERGLVYTKMGTNDLAIADFTEAIKLKPELAQAYNFRGEIYEKQNDLTLAEADFFVATKYNTNYDCATINHRRVLNKLKQIETDQALTNKSVFRQPQDEAKLCLKKRKNREEIFQEQSEQPEKKFRYN